MYIVVDNREDRIYEKLDGLHKVELKQGITIQKAVLPLGDFLIRSDDGIDRILIERKSLADLLASIKDGRYEEQSHRLKNASGLPSHNIIYLIEGFFSSISASEKKMVLSAMASIQYFKGFSVCRTYSIQETTDLIYSMADKINRSLEKGLLPAFSNQNPIEPIANEEGQPCQETSYANFVKKVKKENITAANIGEIMLCQIPGIQSKYANAILLHFGSFSKIVEGLKAGTATADFSKITYECNGKSRKIPKSCGESIVLYLQNI
jgi:ERCC4-type nuclease